MATKSLQTAISGSFKFKPEIDALREAFADHHVDVLAPAPGWLWLPGRMIAPPEFRPLPAERGLGIRQIEDSFLSAILGSDFLYVCNPEGYVGISAAFEMGFSTGANKPIYMQYPPDFFDLADGDLERMAFLKDRLVIASAGEAATLERARQDVAVASGRLSTAILLS